MARKATILGTLIIMVGLAVGATEGRWLNVDVTEHSTDTKVNVHLPMGLVMSVINAVNVEGFEAGKVRLHTEDVDVDWVRLLTSIRDAADGEYVTVRSDDADVKVTKSDDTILITVDQKTDEQAKVEVILPSGLLDAVSIDDEDRLDVAVLLSALDSLPGGDLVRVTSTDADVRVWIE